MEANIIMDASLWVIWILNLIWAIANIAAYRRIKKNPTFEMIFHDDLSGLNSFETTFKGKPVPQIMAPSEVTGTLEGDLTFFDGDILPISGLNRTSVISESKSINPDPFHLLAGIWVCDECGYHNLRTLIKCSKCGSLIENQ